MVGLADEITCTITNDDEAPKLTLVKVVVNNSGGTALASEWELTAAGPTGFDGDGPSVSSPTGFDAGSYDLSESGGPDGYAASSWVCSAGQVDGDSVSVGLGDDITCTITNDDEPATLIVKKVVVNDNGGTATADNFSFQVNGGAAQAFQANGQNDLEVAAGTYNVTEPAVAGYTTTYQGCANIVLELGDTATCVVTNNDVPRGQGSISVSKSANPTTIKEPGGPVTFSVTITNTSADVDVTDRQRRRRQVRRPRRLRRQRLLRRSDQPRSGREGELHLHCARSPASGGTSHVNVVTVSGHDENGNPLTASDDAKVDITPRLIDLVIVKDATSPTPLNGIVNYSLTVTNKGPDTATNVQLADPAPAGITYLTCEPVAGHVQPQPGAHRLQPRLHRRGPDGDDRNHWSGDDGRVAHEHCNRDRWRRPRDQSGGQRRLGRDGRAGAAQAADGQAGAEARGVPHADGLAEDDQGRRQAGQGHREGHRRGQACQGHQGQCRSGPASRRRRAPTARAWRSSGSIRASRGSSR